MRRLAVAAAAAAAFGGPAAAGEPDGPDGRWYVAAAVGASIPGDMEGSAPPPGSTVLSRFEAELGNVVSINAAVGYRLDRFRVEGALSWIRMDIDSWTNRFAKVRTGGKEWVLGLMANGWYDIDLGTALTPFVGGGVGAARVGGQLQEVEGVPGDYEAEHDWVPVWQVGAGVSCLIGQHAAIQFGWRYLDPGRAEGDTVKWDIGGIHVLEVGLRAGF